MITLRLRRFAGAAVLPLVAASALAGCGGSESPSTTTSTAAATGAAGQAGGPGGNDTQMAAIQECLSAAGISLPTPPSGGQPGQNGAPNGAPPSGAPNGTPPSGAPNGTPPSGAPNGTPPSGMPGAAPGGPGGGMFSDAKVVAALKACGITVPTGGPGQGGAAPSASATS
jgi:hypothetical protein